MEEGAYEEEYCHEIETVEVLPEGQCEHSPDGCLEAILAMEGVMCIPACCALHALWGTLYTAGGSIQMVAGVVFLLALPNFKFGSNIVAGVINVLLGVVTLMISCLGNLNCAKCHKLLAITIVILTVNVVNLVILEIGEWYYFLTDDMEQMISENNQMRELAKYARLSTSVTTVVLIIVSFIDSQLTFCSMEYLRKPKYSRYSYNNETDIEYVIPREKGSSGSVSKNSFHHCTQAWVFDAENGTPSGTESPYQKNPSSVTIGNDVDMRNPSTEFSSSRLVESNEGIPRRGSFHSKECQPSGRSDRSYTSHYSTTSRKTERDRRLETPAIKVQVNTAAEDGNEVDRQLNHMKTFYRTPSRGGLSHQSSFSSIPPIYECLERLTQPKVYMSRLDIYRTANEEISRPASASSDYPKPTHSPDQGDNVHYAALVAELEKTLDKKKDSKLGSSTLVSRSESCNTEIAKTENGNVQARGDRQRGSDATFSKELEAALKLIQDLESPNTIDTPSDTCTLVEDAVAKRRKYCGEEDGDTGSSKTSGNGSFDAQGKIQSALPVESQSTSGFNSLSHERSNRITPVPGFSSDDVSKDQGMACIIRHMGDTAVISLFSPTKEPHPYEGDTKRKYVNRINVEKKTTSMTELESRTSEREEKTGKSRLARLRNLIDRRRRPSLLPEVESAIVKSECLAFLTENELKDRLNQTKNIHRICYVLGAPILWLPYEWRSNMGEAPTSLIKLQIVRSGTKMRYVANQAPKSHDVKDLWTTRPRVNDIGRAIKSFPVKKSEIENRAPDKLREDPSLEPAGSRKFLPVMLTPRRIQKRAPKLPGCGLWKL